MENIWTLLNHSQSEHNPKSPYRLIPLSLSLSLPLPSPHSFQYNTYRFDSIRNHQIRYENQPYITYPTKNQNQILSNNHNSQTHNSPLMALITTPPPLNKKPFHFSPLCRITQRPGQSMVLKFGHYDSQSNKLRVKTSFTTLHTNLNKTILLLSTNKASETGPDAANCGRILLSDVIVKRQRKVFWGRKWNSRDLGNAGVVLAMHFLSLFAPFQFSWDAFWVAMALYVITGLFGITLSFHRNLSHRSFNLPKWLEYFFAYCGVQALQGNPIDWVSTHRYHHQFCDSERDPHSPNEGFWFSHMSWLFDTDSTIEKCGRANNVGDLERQSYYRFIQSTYIVHPIALGVLLYALGGFPFLVWGMGVRIVWVFHITWLVNSACHVWGKQAWNTSDLSRNNWWVALLAFGEGWHNNHHAFEYSARHGLEWWQLDITWYVVRFLQAIGLATNVKVPTEIQKYHMALNNGSMTS